MQLRKQIRHTIIETLRGKTQAGDKVNARNREFKNPYPCIEVSTPLEESDQLTNSPASSERSVIVNIEATVEGSRMEIHDKIDDLSQEISDAIGRPGKTQALPGVMRLNKTEMEATNEPEKSIGFLSMSYHTSYMDLDRLNLERSSYAD